MFRRRFVLISVILALLAGVLLSSRPAGATPTRDVDPTKIDAAQLALSQSALPAGAVIDLSQVSDNTDADNSLTHNLLHQHLYEFFHRITGFRMDYHYTVQGVSIQAGYLASIFPTNADAMAALQDATGPSSIIAFLGQPLPDPCNAGDVCKGYSGPNPNDFSKKGLIADFVRGPVLVEASTQVPATTFASLMSAMETQAYLVATTMDSQVKVALNIGSTTGSATDTPTTTATDTATPTATPVPTAKPAPKKCKKGYKRVKGKCKKVKKKKHL